MGSERRWWGWGDDDAEPTLGRAAERLLDDHFGSPRPWPRPTSFDLIELPVARQLPQGLIDEFGGRDFQAGHEVRVRHAVGKGYLDLARLRMGRLENAPDAVMAPASAAALQALLSACARESVAVVPFGGGTSVVGGVEALRGDHRAVISLDLKLLREIEVDRVSLTATLGAGLRGPQAEAGLNAEGLTLGHFPQSFEQATIGGFAATRSAGQASTGYGRFDEQVTSLEMVTPQGVLRSLETPHTAAGPSLRQLILGSEGVLGVIPKVTVRVRPLPAVRRYEAWFCESFAAGCGLIRDLSQAGAAPDLIRLSDETETAITLGLAGEAELKDRMLERYLRLRRMPEGCLIIAGWEGEGESVRRRRALGARVMRSAGGIYLGQSGGRAWARSRFNGPYLRDKLMDRGLMVETLETAQSWRGLAGLYTSVGAAIERAMAAAGTPGIVFCHLSHTYADGASLYFTFACPADVENPTGQWAAVKRAASDAIVGAGATITHHHGVGRDHLPWMSAEIGEIGVATLCAAKQSLDPAGILNPGKLILQP